MTDVLNQRKEFFEDMEKKIIADAAEKIRSALAETFTTKWHSTEGILDLIEKWYGEYIANNLSWRACVYGWDWRWGVDRVKVMDALIPQGYWLQVTLRMNSLFYDDDVTLEQRKWLFEHLIKSEQGKVFLKNIMLSREEHQIVVDMLLETEGIWWDAERDDHYHPGQSPLILEYFEKFTNIDRVKTLTYLLGKWQFKAFDYIQEIPQENLFPLIKNLIGTRDIWIEKIDHYRRLFEWQLSYVDRKAILAHLIICGSDLYVYKNSEKFDVSAYEISQMIKERDAANS